MISVRAPIGPVHAPPRGGLSEAAFALYERLCRLPSYGWITAADEIVEGPALVWRSVSPPVGPPSFREMTAEEAAGLLLARHEAGDDLHHEPIDASAAGELFARGLVRAGSEHLAGCLVREDLPEWGTVIDMACVDWRYAESQDPVDPARYIRIEAARRRKGGPEWSAIRCGAQASAATPTAIIRFWEEATWLFDDTTAACPECREKPWQAQRSNFLLKASRHFSDACPACRATIMWRIDAHLVVPGCTVSRLATTHPEEYRHEVAPFD